MRQMFWRDDRLGWPFVFLVVFPSLFLLAADFAWRVLTIPFETLLIAATVFGFLCILCLIGLYLLLRPQKTLR